MREQKVNQPEPSLIESFGSRKITPKQKEAATLINNFELPLSDKRLLFFYFLWQESRSLAPIKEFGEIREDTAEILDKVIYDDNLVEIYSEFYRSYQRNRLVGLFRRGYSIKDASEELEINRNEVIRMKRILIFEGKVKPNPGTKERVQDFRKFCTDVERLRKTRPEMTSQEMVETLRCSRARLEEAIYILRLAGRINKITRAQRRNEKDIKDEDEIVRIRIEFPEVSQFQIAQKIGLPRHRVAYLISRAIKEDRIPRKRPQSRNHES